MQSQQLQMFLSAIKGAFATVTTLTIKLACPSIRQPQLPTSGSSIASCLSMNDPYGISAVAGVCPNIFHLIVDGPFAPTLLQCLGLNVTCFEFIAPHLPPETIEQLHRLLPNLNELVIKNYPWAGTEVVSPYEFSKMTCVKHLTAGKLHIQSDKMWASFPPNLVTLACAGMSIAPPVAASLQALQDLHLTYINCTLKVLAGVFRSAPNLLQVVSATGVIRVNSGLASGDPLGQAAITSLAADLNLLNSRHEAGVTSCPFTIMFHDCEDLQNVLQAVTVLTAFTRVALDWVSVHTTASLLRLVSRVFANVCYLEMRNSETMDDKMLVTFLPLQQLEDLSFFCCPRITAQGLTFLCSQLRSLSRLSCVDLEGVSEEQANLLQIMMTATGRQFVLDFIR